MLIGKNKRSFFPGVNSLLVRWFGKEPTLFTKLRHERRTKSRERGNSIRAGKFHNISLPSRVITTFSFLSFPIAFSEECINSARCVRVKGQTAQRAKVLWICLSLLRSQLIDYTIITLLKLITKYFGDSNTHNKDHPMKHLLTCTNANYYK